MSTSAFNERPFTILEYLHGKVADFTVSENAIISIMADRGVEADTLMSDTDKKTRMLCYADLLKYIYLSPNMTKSYSQTNGTWSQKEGATQISVEDKRKILAEMRKLYAQCGEASSAPASKPAIRMVAHGMRLYKK